jgi:hypothetical protein
MQFFLIEHIEYVMREEITGYLEWEWHITLPITSKWNDFFHYDFCIFYNVPTVPEKLSLEEGTPLGW